jgi:predicted nucleic acid-binding Zn ribbon protein
MKSMGRKLDRLSNTLGSMLKARGLGSRLDEYRVFGQWEKSVGPVIAHHAQPQTVRGKKLTLVVDSPAWMQQLSLLKPQIVEKVNRTLGKETIKDITLRLGEVESREHPSEESPVRTVLGRDEREKIEDYVREISDTDTREAVRRVIEKDFLSRKRDK